MAAREEINSIKTWRYFTMKEVAFKHEKLGSGHEKLPVDHEKWHSNYENDGFNHNKNALNHEKFDDIASFLLRFNHLKLELTDLQNRG